MRRGSGLPAVVNLVLLSTVAFCPAYSMPAAVSTVEAIWGDTTKGSNISISGKKRRECEVKAKHKCIIGRTLCTSPVV